MVISGYRQFHIINHHSIPRGPTIASQLRGGFKFIRSENRQVSTLWLANMNVRSLKIVFSNAISKKYHMMCLYTRTASYSLIHSNAYLDKRKQITCALYCLLLFRVYLIVCNELSNQLYKLPSAFHSEYNMKSGCDTRTIIVV